MEGRQHLINADDDAHRPAKRARHSPPPESNGHVHHSDQTMPPLSLSILGVEPLDEFIREIADFVHHMIMTRPDRPGTVEVEAKVGVLREKTTGQRLAFPVQVETSKCSARFF
jgi:polynucleotide 5'-triphosphatase